MVFPMKTTLVIDDHVMKRLRQEAVREGRTISELVEAALRRFLNHEPPPTDLPPLPAYEGRGTTVDVSDRRALYELMVGR